MKKMSAILLVIMLLLSLVACSDTAVNDLDTETVDQMEENVGNETLVEETENQEIVADEIGNEETEDSEPVEEPLEGVPAEETAGGLRPEFKEAMDDYEVFYNEYCDFMKEYMENPTDLGLLGEYAGLVSKAADMDEAFDTWNESEMSAEELQYYLDVNNRVMQKLLEVGQ